jgi:hypothetical protein
VRLSGFLGKTTGQKRKSTMKIIPKTIMVSALGLALATNVFAQINTNLQFTAATSTDEQAIRLTWTSTNGELYQIQYANALATNSDGSTAWQTLYDDYPSQGTNTFWLDTGNYNLAPAILHPKYMPMRFYRILDKGADTLLDEPNVSVTSPTSGTAVTGELTITVAAATDQPVLSGTKLYVDGQEMRPADSFTNWNDGVTNYEVDTYSINTCEWGNGTHTLFAIAENQSGFSDAMNSPPVYSGHAASAFVPVTFSNLVTRISFSQPSFDPSSGQTQQVSAVFAANCNWTLNICDLYSNVVQTVSGSGTSMLYNWDGTANGTNLPNGIYYYYINAQTNGESSDFVSGGSSGGSGGNPPSPSFARSSAVGSDSSSSMELWAVPVDLSGAPVPLALYPPGIDTSGLTIFEASPAEIQSLRPSVSRTSFSAMNSGGSFSPDASGGGSSASSQGSPAAPQRPPNNPVRGLAGSFAIAYQTFTGNGPGGYHLNSPANKPYFQQIKIENSSGGTFLPRPRAKLEAENFVSEMQHWGWTNGFVKADDQLKLSDMQGSGTPFNQVNLGVFIGHGTYGTTSDQYANACNQMYFPITAGTSAQWLRMSDMNLGGAGTNGLKWIAFKTCVSLYPSDWQSMQYYGIHPYNSNLHLLLGSATDCASSATQLSLWAKYMNFGTSTNYSPLTVRAAWYQSAKDAYRGVLFPSGTVMKFGVAGDSACLDDLLQTNNAPQGSWTYPTPVQVYP